MNSSQNHLSQFTAIALILCVSASLRETSPAAEKPNVLLILVDDLKPALGCYGDPHAKTPNIDKLAARGMRFDLAYCNQSVCAPSRFTLMLGSHSTSTGLYGLGSHLRKAIPDAVTLPQHFAKHGGYRTESLGKIFHIGHGNHGDPDSFSVPHFKEKVIEYRDPASKPDGKLTREEAMFQNKPAPPGGMNKLARGAAFESPEVEDDAYADGRVAAETIRRLRKAKQRRKNEGTPFFIASGFARPHLPFSAPKTYWDLYDPTKLPLATNPNHPKNSPKIAHKRGGEIRNYFPVPDKNDPAPINDEIARQLVHGYYASVSYVDAQIGKVIDGLDKLGLAESTIIVLWGDHGFHLGDLGIWTKHTNYEQANRIPILISAPGVTKPNTSTKQLAESVDIFPTLAELAGLTAPQGPQPIDGKSLVPVLKDPIVRVRDHAFHAYPRKKLGRAIRTERYRLVEWGDEYELYDYKTDPLESANIAAKNPEIVGQLKEILARHPEPFRRGRKKTAKVDTYDLVIVAGQSNAVGFDAKPTELPEDPNDKKVLFWWKTGDPPPDKHDSHSSNAWTNLQAQPLGNPAPGKSAPRQYGNFAQPEGGFGPEIGFARHLLEKEPQRKIAILKVAFSGTSIPQDWDPTKKDQPGSCYQAFLIELEKARAAAKEKNIVLAPKTLLWVQGESDANPKNAPRYAEDLSKLISAIRRDTQAPQLKALLAVNTRFSNGKNKHMPAIVEAQKKVAASDPHSAYVDTAEAPIANGAHYNTKGTLQVGKWFAQAFLKQDP